MRTDVAVIGAGPSDLLPALRYAADWLRNALAMILSARLVSAVLPLLAVLLAVLLLAFGFIIATATPADPTQTIIVAGADAPPEHG